MLIYILASFLRCGFGRAFFWSCELNEHHDDGDLGGMYLRILLCPNGLTPEKFDR